MALSAFCGVLPAAAGVFHSRDSALRLAFPAADRVEARQLVLSREEAARVRQEAGAGPGSRLVTAYAGYAGDEPLGWAFLDTHTVRTLPETVLLVLSPDGHVRGTHLLAFHEPEEYQPPEGWLARLAGLELGPELRIGGRVDSISGSTLTAGAVTASVRRMLAVWQVKLSPDAVRAGEPLP
jgi:hypothetical protein